MAKEKKPAAIQQLAAMGYDGLEFWNDFLMSCEVSWLAEYLKENRIICAQICPYFDFTGTRERWDESIGVAEQYIKFAVQLGGPLIRVFTGKVGAGKATSEEWKAGIEGIRTICQMGKPHGIIFALEAHGGSLMETSDSTLRLLEDVAMGNLGLNLQVPFPGENIRDSVEKLGRYTIHLHAHNWVFPPSSPEAEHLGEQNLTFLDSGWLDFREFIRHLMEKGFAGYISIEHATHGGKHTWQETALHEIKFLKSLIDSFEQNPH
jgi:sugar phosphate isomerase/epimerase